MQNSASWQLNGQAHTATRISATFTPSEQPEFESLSLTLELDDSDNNGLIIDIEGRIHPTTFLIDEEEEAATAVLRIPVDNYVGQIQYSAVKGQVAIDSFSQTDRKISGHFSFELAAFMGAESLELTAGKFEITDMELY